MLKTSDIEGCSHPEALCRLLGTAPGAVVHVRALALPTMFPGALADALAELPYEVAAGVAAPEVARALGVKSARLGDVLVFSHGLLVGRIAKGETNVVARAMGLLASALSPWLNKTDRARWEDDETDPFAVIGVAPSASFDEVHAAWRARLAEYHPDRFARAGVKIRDVAESESQRLNAAFRAIAERQGRRGFPS